MNGRAEVLKKKNFCKISVWWMFNLKRKKCVLSLDTNEKKI